MSPAVGGGWTEDTIHTFIGNGDHGDGCEPLANLITDASSRDLFGTTRYGGEFGQGTVFELTPSSGGGWIETRLYSFTGGTDGANPYSPVLFDAAGNLYGNTIAGGAYGYGTVFELTPSGFRTWTEQVLHSFGQGTDGVGPIGNLLFNQAGILYGVTEGGGVGSGGIVFELQPLGTGGWHYQTIHNFTYTDIANLKAGLIMDASGNLYGTSETGGAFGQGTVFELIAGSDGDWTERILHSFRGAANGDGANPVAPLVFDQAGNLYGTTELGGVAGEGCLNHGCGTIFVLSPVQNGPWTERHFNFPDTYTSGLYPLGALVLDSSGNLYGMTSEGGLGNGTIFEITR